MGKRELLIAAVFAVLGVVAYQIAAPSPAEGSRPFSFASIGEAIRGRHSATRSAATVTTSGVVAISSSLSELRLANLHKVTVVGETRDDIAWSFVVEAAGSDDTVARAHATDTVLKTDDVGGVLSVSVEAGKDAHQTNTLTLRVPARLVVRVESAKETSIEGVSGVRLENLVGDVTIRRITGAVGGGHRNGRLTIEDVGDLSMTLVSSNATITRVGGTCNLTARNGQARITRARGPITMETSAQSVVIDSPAAPVRVSGIAGELFVGDPLQDVHIDGRRMKTMLTIGRAVPATLFTTEGTVTLTLAADAGVAVDIASVDAKIDASAFALTPQIEDRHTRLSHRFGGDIPVAIRGERSDVVIALRK